MCSGWPRSTRNVAPAFWKHGGDRFESISTPKVHSLPGDTGFSTRGGDLTLAFSILLCQKRKMVTATK